MPERTTETTVTFEPIDPVELEAALAADTRGSPEISCQR